MSVTNHQTRFLAAQVLAREAGVLALQHFRNRELLQIEQKGAQDWVSEADRGVEVFIREKLQSLFPEDGFLGEESGSENLNAEGIWVVDPIDGTSCFLHGLPSWCVSIAYLYQNEVKIGIIYAPCTDEMYAAHLGHGAFLNGRLMKPNNASSLSEGMVGMGYNPKASTDATLKAMNYLLENGGVYHRNGSGALTTAYVAAGKYIGFYEAQINSWDCLAGIAMVKEVGGWVNDFLANDGLTQGNALLVTTPASEKAMQNLFTVAGHSL